MKTRIYFALLISLVLWINIFSLQAFDYQTLLSDPTGVVLSMRNVKVKATLYNGTSQESYYCEVHSLSTGFDGLLRVPIGKGELISGKWEEIPWKEKNIYLRIELDKDQTGNYTLYSQSELLSVPYAYFADKAAEQIEAKPIERLQLDSAFYLVNTKSIPDTILTVKDGKIGIGTTHPRADVEFGLNKRLHLSSQEWHLDKSGVITLQALNDKAKPSMTWYDEFGVPHAALTMYDRSTIDPVHQKEFAIETDNGKGELKPRFTIAYGRDMTTVGIHNSDFSVSDGNFSVGSLRSGGKSYINGSMYVSQRLAVGNKDWVTDGSFSSSYADIEIFQPTNPAEMLIKTGDDHSSSLTLARGENQWKLENNGDLLISNNQDTVLTLSAKGNLGLGVANPLEKLDVDGSVRARTSFKAKGRSIAMYFESEENIMIGWVVGINPLTGKARKYQSGDHYIGVATPPIPTQDLPDAALILNAKPGYETASNQILTTIMGVVNVAGSQSIPLLRQAYWSSPMI